MEVEVLVRGEDINNVIGHKKENIQKLLTQRRSNDLGR